MQPKNTEKKLDELVSAAIGRDNLEFDFDKWKNEHAREIHTYESQACTRSPHQITGILRYAVAALIAIALMLGISQWVGPLTGIAWADVKERFSSVPFFSASIYIKEDATSEPKQVELWMSHDGRTRLRTGTQVIFGKQGKVTDAFDITSRSKVEPDMHASFLLQKLGSTDTFSLDLVINVMFRGEMKDITPLINPDAVISQDMVVFDIQSPISPEWLRIWALRESRLPVRIKVWDPRNGEGTDVVFSYSKEQPDEFFDPNAFSKLLQSRAGIGRANLAYAYQKDPGGKPITPEDLFETNGFHVPEIDQVGITCDGAVWVIANKGRNRSPQGHVFDGFAEIEDNLGREYQRVYRSHRVSGDQSIDVFVPTDYPFDTNVPGKIILKCKMDEYDARGRDPLVGTVELTTWSQGELWPDGTIDATPQSLATTLAWNHARAKLYDKTETILATISGQPRDSKAALQRERIRLYMLVSQEQYDEALALGKSLMPILEKDFEEWKGYAPNVSVFTDYMVALGCTKQLDELKQTWAHIKSIEPKIPDTLNARAKQHIEEDIERGYENAMRIVVPDLSRKAHLSIEQMNELFDLDIKNNEAFKNYTFWDWNPQYDRPEYRNWEQHLAELAEYYKDHPLPERVEILERKADREYRAHTLRMPGIETHYAECLNTHLFNYIIGYKYPESAGCIRVEDDVENIELSHDLVYNKDTVKFAEHLPFIIEHFGLEIVEVNEPRRVWIARHDGRELKDYKLVKAPVPFDGSGIRKAGMMTMMTSSGFPIERLLREVSSDQNKALKARSIVVIDETGITDTVALEVPDFEGPEGLDIAEKWFSEEMGVTFTEEQRTMTTYIFRKKTR